MKILTVLTYFRPHISGLTRYAERLCRALAERGHAVTVLTSQFDRNLPLFEQEGNLRVIRVPVALRISKGVLMPTIGFQATRLVRSHDLVHLHLPQFDAAGFSLRGLLFRRPVVLTYHCDLALPPSPFHWVVEQVVGMGNSVSMQMADVIVSNTLDFVRSSQLLSRFAHKTRVIAPPIEVADVTEEDKAVFREKYQVRKGKPLIGIVARLSAEKGIEYLLQALPKVIECFPDVEVLHVGPREPVGEAAYAQRLMPLLKQFEGRYRFLGAINDTELAAFYSICSVNVLPSVNSTESFGMVQVEAALLGTPSVVTDLPGVRVAGDLTGMSKVVPARDAVALADGIIEVLSNRARYLRPSEEIAERSSPARVAEQYEQIFVRLLAKANKKDRSI